MGLSSDTITFCTEVFKKCDEFKKDSTLRACFVSEKLKPYQGNVPQADSIDERVSLFISEIEKSGKQALLEFVNVLLDNHRGQGIYQDLQELKLRLRKDFGMPYSVPFVIAAMTKKEAKALKKGADFSPQELERFREFERELADIGITNWVEQYGKRRDDWRPLGQESSIWQEVLNVAAAVEPAVIPISYSDKVFAEDEEVRRATWNELADSGGIVVIDAISMFHPNIRERLRDSGLTYEKKIPVFTLSPSDALDQDHPINGPIKNYIKQWFSRMFGYLFDHTLPEEGDPECEIGISGLRSLRRWLHRTIPHVIPVVRADEDSLRMMQGKYGEGRGVVNLVSGGGGES